MKTHRVQTVTEQLIRADIAAPSTMEGCTEKEIQQIEARFSLRLPNIYRSFLGAMGKSAGQFMQGSDFLYPALLEFREQAERLLQEAEVRFLLAPNDFVFLVHQGYEFLYFDCRAADDPPVWFYLEKEPQPKKLFNCFSEWLVAAAVDETN